MLLSLKESPSKSPQSISRLRRRQIHRTGPLISETQTQVAAMRMSHPLRRVESIDQAISLIESLNGSGTFGKANQPTRTISKASRRKMAQAQRARWARAKKASQPVVAIAKTTGSARVKHTMSTAARRRSQRSSERDGRK